LSLLGSSNSRVVLYRDMPNISIQKGRGVDILLTPQFYTSLKEDLEVKFAYQAKQIAPSLFDDYIEDIEGYQFAVYKDGKDWHFFAFNIEDIFKFVEERGLNRYQVGKIYFAQELNRYLESPLEIGDSYALVDIDGITTIVPKSIVDRGVEYINLDISKLPLKNGVSIGGSLSLISFKHTVTLSIILLLFAIILMVEGNRLKGAIELQEQKVEELLDKNPKLSSSRIRESILSQYEPIDREERVKRSAIGAISKAVSRNPNLYIKELSLDGRAISALIESPSGFSRLRPLFNNRYLKEQNFQIEREGSSIRLKREFQF